MHVFGVGAHAVEVAGRIQRAAARVAGKAAGIQHDARENDAGHLVGHQFVADHVAALALFQHFGHEFRSRGGRGVDIVDNGVKGIFACLTVVIDNDDLARHLFDAVGHLGRLKHRGVVDVADHEQRAGADEVEALVARNEHVKVVLGLLQTRRGHLEVFIGFVDDDLGRHAGQKTQLGDAHAGADGVEVGVLVAHDEQVVGL